MQTLQASYRDHFNQLLPVFIYTDANQLSVISSDMDRAIKKATKVISQHSITVKPEIDPKKELTEKERAFYSKREYNKWIDDSYLLMGKAHMYRNETDKAQQTFEYIVSNYPDEIPAFEARIWLARLAIGKKRMKEAGEILNTLEKDILFPGKLKSELFTTKAYLSLSEENYKEASASLKTALDNTKSTYFKQRYTYLLAQIYQLTGQTTLANQYFQKVIKLNPAYEMTFNARINMALTYQSGSGSRKEIEKQLQKMLRDDKNIDYRDQIYYAWGNLYLKSGDVNKAIEYYRIAAAVGKNNNEQLAITYLTIADLYYKKPEYMPAQAYYDSAVGIIDASYPDYPLILAKSTSLTNLVVHIETVQLEDSVQVLARQPKDKVYALIDNLITDRQKADEEARLKELELKSKENEITQQQFELQTNRESSWYFYNSTSLNLGKQEFKKRWGTRKLEDNWRRKNKASVSLETFAEEDASEIKDTAASANAAGKKIANIYSREYYLQNIPFTDSALKVSHESIRVALFEMGNIYSNDLKDNPKAIQAYTQLLKRYPQTDNKLQVYYKLYLIGIETQDASLASQYKQKIIIEFPESNYAMVLGDPEYVKKVEQEQAQYQKTYANAYELFRDRQFLQAASISKRALNEFPDKELTPNFEYILVVSEGVTKDTTQFLNDLQKYIAKYPQTDASKNAAVLVKFLQNVSPEAAMEQQVMAAKEIYSADLNQAHLVAIAVPKRTNTNQLMFNIINFNIDNFERADLKVIKVESGNHVLLVVNLFANSNKALEYYRKALATDDIWRDVNKSGSEIFIISQTNFESLKKAPGIDSYLVFFREQYK